MAKEPVESEQDGIESLHEEELWDRPHPRGLPPVKVKDPQAKGRRRAQDLLDRAIEERLRNKGK